MPRELVHWKVLEDAIDALPTDSAGHVKHCLQQQQAAAYLGAVAHDGPYYFQNGNHPFEFIAQMLHGKYGGDTLAALRGAAQGIFDYQEPVRSKMWGFLLGMLSHMVTDVVFHPVVYYFTGDYYSPDEDQRRNARVRHRIFEVYLDSWVHQDLRLWNRGYIDVVIQSLGTDVEVLYDFLDARVVPAICAEALLEPAPSGCDEPGLWKEGIEKMSRAQRMFLSPWYGVLARAISCVSFSRFDAIEALFTFGRSAPAGVFDSSLNFQNPITGESYVRTLPELLAEARDECVRLFRKCDPLVSGACTSVDEILGDEIGKSLDFGIYLKTPQRPQYLSEEGFPLPGLRFG